MVISLLVSENLVKIWLDCVAGFQNLVGNILVVVFGKNLVGKSGQNLVGKNLAQSGRKSLFEQMFDYNELVTIPKNA